MNLSEIPLDIIGSEKDKQEKEKIIYKSRLKFYQEAMANPDKFLKESAKNIYNCSRLTDIKSCPNCGYTLPYGGRIQVDKTNRTISCPKCSKIYYSAPWQNIQHSQHIKTITCPTCGSADVEKISLGKKIVGISFWGLYDSNIRKTFKCNSCGYKW